MAGVCTCLAVDAELHSAGNVGRHTWAPSTITLAKSEN